MPRLSLAAALLLVSGPLLAQSVPTEAAVPARHTYAGGTAQAPPSVDADPLTESETARRIARLYVRHADLLLASADGHDSKYASLLEGLVGDLELLAQRPGILYEPRFRELYASVLTEKERFYGTEALDRGDVYAVNDEAFRMIYSTSEPTLDAVVVPTVPQAQTVRTTIPMEVTPSVERSIRYLLRKQGHVATLRQRADTYFPMVERILAEEGVPDELKYLAMVESALNPSARSHMAAAGMWQFIRATGGAYGLQANSEIDHRLDPELSTRAAARHLRDLYDRFGDWQLALAGYNCNPAVIARAVRRHEERTGERATFWDIDHAIPKETRGYVPMFIATSLILSNPDAYGFEAPAPGPVYAFDRIPVAPGTSLTEVSRLIDVDESVLRALNPALRRGRVPSTRMPHTVRIPVGFYERHASALNRLASPEAEGMNLTAETVTFGTRANRPLASEAPAEILMAARVRPGSPASSVSSSPTRPPLPPVAVTRPEPQVAEPQAAEPMLVAAAVSAPEASASAAPEAVSSALPTPRDVTETVAVAEVPTKVAASPAAQPSTEPLASVQEAPSIREQMEAAGRADAARAQAREDTARQVTAEVATPVAEARPEPRPEPVAAPSPPVRLAADTRSSTPATHRVQRGEHLTMIGRQYGISVRDLQGWNGIEGSTLHVGQRLRLTPPSGYDARATRTTRSPAVSTVTHRVARGENLTQIARKYGVSLNDIRRWNSLDRDTIVPGQRLKIEKTSRTARG